MAVRIINLTPHPVRLLADEGGHALIIEVPPSGTIARAEERTELEGHLQLGAEGARVPVYRVVRGQPVGLPEPEEGTIYIVSSPAAAAVREYFPDRRDVFVPYDSSYGWIVGARGLARL